MKRLAAITIAIICVLMTFVSCSSGDESVTLDSRNTSEALKIGSASFSYDMLRYWFCSYKYTNRKEPLEDEKALDLAIERLKEIAAIYEISDEEGVSLSRTDAASIMTDIVSQRESYDSPSKYREALYEGYLTEKTYFDVSCAGLLEEKLYDYMTKESDLIDRSVDKIRETIYEEFLAASNILIPASLESNGRKGEELALYILEKINAGGDFSEYAEQYSADSETGVRYFAPLTMQEYFEEKVRSLGITEVSGVYQSELGYNITRREPIEPSYVVENFDELTNEYLYSEFLKIMTAKTSSYKVSFADGFEVGKIDK